MTSTETFVPYSKLRTETDDLSVLRAEWRLMVDTYGRRSSHAAEAFEHLLKTSVRVGEPIDGLRHTVRDEVARFFSQVIPGPEKHCYWIGSKYGFLRNDRKSRVPRKWWWEHLHGVQPTNFDVVATCGDEACINPDHCRGGVGLRHQRYAEEEMLRLLRERASRLGRAPRIKEWDEWRWSPGTFVYRHRFGSWDKALIAAGLTPSFGGEGTKATLELCLLSVKAAKDVLGRWPNYNEFRYDEAVRVRLTELNLPRSIHSVKRYLGPAWHDVIYRASRA